MVKLIHRTLITVLLAVTFFTLGAYSRDILPLARPSAAGTGSGPGAAQPLRPPALAVTAGQSEPPRPNAAAPATTVVDPPVTEALFNFAAVRGDIQKVSFGAADMIKMLEALDMEDLQLTAQPEPGSEPVSEPGSELNSDPLRSGPQSQPE